MVGVARDPLPIRSLTFLGGMAARGGWRPPSTLPEVAVVGRSNVGKSSLLNRLFHRKQFARVSNTPGRTREINFFSVNDTFVLVDLPGYGFARVAQSQRDAWRPLIESYLRNNPRLKGILMLLDSRRALGDEDRRMLELLADLGIPMILVLTKIDKFSASRAAAQVEQLTRAADVGEDQVIPFSAVTNAGRDEIAAAIVGLITP